jgi:hypothetical protein
LRDHVIFDRTLSSRYRLKLLDGHPCDKATL